ncbi:MAG: c-type cytochrome [Planctomycetia bacterium]|nr:c-type cytochrome [Planctomycetia bacterium]
MKNDRPHRTNGPFALVLGAAVAFAGFAPTPARAADPKLEFPRIPPTKPADAAKSFEVQDGFRMTLIAAEPLVASPVGLEYDEHGQGWVLEMRDYPFTNKETDKPFADKSADLPLGRIRVLRDVNGDGIFDESQIFADDISWPTGLAFWKGGVFVAATPDLWYLKDTDGDGRADVRRKLFTGFRKFNIQAVINNLKWGLDHQVYGAGGTNGGKIEALESPDASPVTLATNDFRIDPVAATLEALSGGARFGLSFDDWGNRFLCNIRNPVIHVVLPAHYLARNPAVPVQKAVFDAAEAGDTLPVYRISPPEAWRTLRAQRWSGDAEGLLYPRSELVPDGYFTSGCGITIYRGEAYPPEYYGQAFLSDVAANLVHREALAAQGVTFRARRIDEQTEFVRLRDTWFRPVNFVNAPDGTLHVVDMYRETIEHPWSIPDDIKAALDLESGRELGRLWRLEPDGFRLPKPPKLADASTAELVALLEHKNAWHRETAHRLIFEQQDQAAIAPLRDLLSQSRNPVARLHALWSLAGLNSLSNSDLLARLADPAGGVREHAVRLAEPRLKLQRDLQERVLALADDPESRVRFQVAFSLGQVEGDSATRALVQIARRDGADEHIRAAVLSSSSRRGAAILSELLQDRSFAASEESRALLRLLAQSVGTELQSDDLKLVARTLVDAPADDAARSWKTEVISGLGEGTRRKGKPLAAVFAELEPRVNLMTRNLLEGAARLVVDARAGVSDRIQAAGMLGFGTFAAAKEPLFDCLDSRQPSDLQLAAIRTLAAFAEPEVGTRLLAGWGNYSPPVRTEVVEAMLSRPDRIPLLFDEIEKKTIGVAQISPVRRGRLMRHTDEAIRNRANILLAVDAPGPRGDVIRDYEQKLATLKGDARRGLLAFERECATCHRLANKGQDVGPSLETIRHHAPRQVLTNILDPSREVSPAYVEYVVVTKEGRTATGIVSAETATSVTLRRANNVQETILRDNIEEIAGSGKSLMPDGMEQKIPPQEMANLLAFLLGPKPNPGDRQPNSKGK